MTTQQSKRSRFWLPVILLALAVALALGGCARTSHSGNTPASSQQGTTTTGQGTGSSNTNDELNSLQQVDQQTQNDLNGLNNDQNNTDQNISEPEQQP